RVTITDHDGAVIPNAEIIVESRSGRGIFTGQTGPAGEWTSGAMAPGEYQVTARANGFRTFLATVVVHEGNLTSLKLKLAVEELKQTIDVTSPSVEVMGTYVIRDPIPIHSTTLPPSVLTGQRAPMR
ncbi:MAG TPA: carboxypeptidase-like regulatory domain-containing protein, partial [Candidatus Angelobacter sp.]|nr:carboxypeptidase-like regulatory domain-containing protein [Candidatus Angelobacter sp.]